MPKLENYQEMILTEGELYHKLKLWQERLGLQDWDVVVSICRARDFISPNAMGECNWVLPKKMAAIRILHQDDFDQGSMQRQDMELTLVHELLHLHHAPFDTFPVGTPEDIAVEQAIHKISKALVDLYRERLCDNCA